MADRQERKAATFVPFMENEARAPREAAALAWLDANAARVWEKRLQLMAAKAASAKAAAAKAREKGLEGQKSGRRRHKSRKSKKKSRRTRRR